MANDDIITPGAVSKVRAKFFKGESGQDYVHVTIVGDPCDIIHKVTPEHVMRWPNEWKAFQAGEADVPVNGTRLTEVPGVDENLSLAFKLKGVRTAEELAGLDETAARALGMGGLSAWQSAKNLLELRRLQALQELTASRKPQPELRKGA